MTTCNNCNNTFEANFCNVCGQSKAMNEKLNTHHLATDLFHSIFHTGSGMIHTLKILVKSPEVVIKEYISGRRKYYFSPIKLYLISSFIYFAVSHFVVKDDKNEFQLEVNHILEKYKYVYMFGALLIKSFLNWLLFRKQKINFADNFIAVMFIQSIMDLNVSFFMILNYVFFITGFISIDIVLIGTIISFLYYTYAMTRFFNTKNRILTISLNIFIYLLSMMLVLLPFIFLIDS